MPVDKENDGFIDLIFTGPSVQSPPGHGGDAPEFFILERNPVEVDSDNDGVTDPLDQYPFDPDRN